jgi:hypothetical protein
VKAIEKGVRLMQFFHKGELFDVIPLVVMFLCIIYVTSSKDEHYVFRISVPTITSKIFFNNVKEGTVPLITFSTAIQFYISLYIFVIAKLMNSSVNLGSIMETYLIVPWFIVTFVIFVIEIVGMLLRYFKK